MKTAEAQRIANNFFTRYEGSSNPEEIYSTEINNRLRDQILDAFNASHPTSLPSDWTKECSCNPDDKTGETWCCNTCGKPTPRLSTELPSDEEIEESLKYNSALQYDNERECALIGAKWMRSIASARIAEVEREIESLKDDIDVLKARLLLND